MILKNLQTINLLLDPDSMGSIGHDLHETLPERQSLSDMINDNVKLQQRRIQQQLKTDVEYLLNNNSNVVTDRARLHSLSGKGAGAWVSAIPFSSYVALSPHDFRLATTMRLGCDILWRAISAKTPTTQTDVGSTTQTDVGCMHNANRLRLHNANRLR